MQALQQKLYDGITTAQDAALACMSPRPLGETAPRRLRWGLYLLILVTAVVQTAITPLLPLYEARFGLSSAGSGLLLGLPSLASLAFCLPSGSLADRFGPRRLTLAAGFAIALAAVVQAVAPSFLVLLLARLVFGAGYGVLWTAGLAWFPTKGSSRGLGATVVFSGLGCIAGPLFAGLAAQYVGLALPFLASAGAIGVVTLVLFSVGDSTSVTAHRTDWRGALVDIADEPRAMAALAIVVVAGIVYGMTSLLAPLELHAGGMSTGEIGAAFAVVSVIYVLASIGAVSAGRRIVRVPVALFAALLAMAGLVLGGLSTAPLVVIALLVASFSGRAVIWTVAYPLGSDGARRAGIGVGVVLGLVNAVSALVNFLVPLAAGTMAGSVGYRGAFDFAVLGCLAVFGIFSLHVRTREQYRVLEGVVGLARRSTTELAVLATRRHAEERDETELVGDSASSPAS